MDRQTPADQYLAHADSFWEVLGGRGRILDADEAEDDRSVTLTRRKSMKHEARKTMLEGMTSSQKFQHLWKERMEQVAQILHNKWWTIWISSLTV